jgi:hypothetical protein
MRRWFSVSIVVGFGGIVGLLQLCYADESVVVVDGDDGRYASCSICPGVQEPILGDLELTANTAGVLPFRMTCDQAQAMARSGSFSPATCLLLRSRIYDICVCAVVATDGTCIRGRAM